MSCAENDDWAELILPNKYEPQLGNSSVSATTDDNPPFIDISHFMEYYHSTAENLDPANKVGQTAANPWKSDSKTDTSSDAVAHVAQRIWDCAEFSQNVFQDKSFASKPDSTNENAIALPECDYKNWMNYCPDFSDFQDETYSFWNSNVREAPNGQSSTYSQHPSGDGTKVALHSAAIQEQVTTKTNDVVVSEATASSCLPLPSFRTVRRARPPQREFQNETSTFKVCDSTWISPSTMLPSSSVYDTPVSVIQGDEGGEQSRPDASWNLPESNTLRGELLPYEIVSTYTPEIQDDAPFRQNKVDQVTLTLSDSQYASPHQGIEMSALQPLKEIEQPQYYLLTTGGERYLILVNSKGKSCPIPNLKSNSVLSPVTSADECLRNSGFTRSSLDTATPGREKGLTPWNEDIPFSDGLNQVSAPTPFDSFTSLASNSEEKCIPPLEAIIPTAESSSNLLVLPRERSRPLLIQARASNNPEDKVLHCVNFRNKIDRLSPTRFPIRTIHQRRKTVKELLKEKQQRKAIETITKHCLVNRSLSTITCPIKSVRPVFTDASGVESNKSPIVLHTNADVVQNENIVVPQMDSVPTNKEFISETNSQGQSSLENAMVTHISPSLINALDVDDPPVSAPSNSLPEITSLPPFKLGRVDAKEYKPKHFDLLGLEIGTFTIKKHENSEGKLMNKFKVLFTKRQFIYEFCTSAVPGAEPSNRIACIVVPFKTVCAISCADNLVQLRVNCQPQAFLGSRQRRIGIIANINVFDTSKAVDITHGEAARCRNHKLFLQKQQADKLRMLICNFDSRFRVLTMIPVGEDYWSSKSEASTSPLPESHVIQKKIRKCAKDSIRQPPFQCLESCLPGVQVCSCRISCSSLRCSCAKAAQKCNVGHSVCICSECDNPLNIMESIGIDPELAIQDSCLFHNIYQIKNFRRYLAQELAMPCCNVIATLQECIPFRVLCPNTECPEIVEYSWCREMLCSAERNPRNHCAICGRCCFSMGRHCSKCNACYPTKPQSQGCPKCSVFSSAFEPIKQKLRPAEIVTLKDSARSSTDLFSPTVLELEVTKK